MSCGVALEVDPSGSNDFTYYFDAVTTTMDIGTFTNWFTELEPTCAITGCEIKNEGCSDAYSGDNLSIAAGSPWTVTAA